MQTLEQLQTLRTEHAQFHERLRSVAVIIQAEQREATAMRSEADSTASAAQAAAEALGATLAGRATGTATAKDEDTARAVLAAAEIAAAASRAREGTMLSSGAKIKGLEAALRPTNERMTAIAADMRRLTEQHIREQANETAAAYAHTAAVLALQAAEVLAFNRVLALLDFNPDIELGSLRNILVPGFNVPAAKTGTGCLVSFEGQVQPHMNDAFARCASELRADGLTIPGTVGR